VGGPEPAAHTPCIEQQVWSRRTVVLCRPETMSRETQRLASRYGLEIVYTAFTDTESSRLVTLIAVHHIIEHDAEVVVIPHITAARIANDQQWHAVDATTEIITSDGPVRDRCR
jgi:hypothetical protein